MFLFCIEWMEVDQTKPVHDQRTYQKYKKMKAKDLKNTQIYSILNLKNTQIYSIKNKNKKQSLLDPKLVTLDGSLKFDEVLLGLSAQTRTKV